MSGIAQHRQPEPGDGGESTPSRAIHSSTSRAKRSKQDAHRHKLLAIFLLPSEEEFFGVVLQTRTQERRKRERDAFVSGKPEPFPPFFSTPFTVTSSGSYRHIERYVLTERKATTSFVCPPSVSPRRCVLIRAVCAAVPSKNRLV